MGPLRCHTPDTWLSRGRPDGYVTHPAVAAYRGCVTVEETVNATPGWANSSYVNTTERCTDYPYMPEWDEPYFANSTLELTLLNDSWAEGLGDPNTAADLRFKDEIAKARAPFIQAPQPTPF